MEGSGARGALRGARSAPLGKGLRPLPNHPLGEARLRARGVRGALRGARGARSAPLGKGLRPLPNLPLGAARLRARGGRGHAGKCGAMVAGVNGDYVFGRFLE